MDEPGPEDLARQRVRQRQETVAGWRQRCKSSDTLSSMGTGNRFQERTKLPTKLGHNSARQRARLQQHHSSGT